MTALESACARLGAIPAQEGYGSERSSKLLHALSSGQAAPAAMQAAGLPPALSTFAGGAGDALAAVLDRLAGPLAAAITRRRSMGDRALYPLVLAIMSVAVTRAIGVTARPAFQLATIGLDDAVGFPEPDSVLVMLGYVMAAALATHAAILLSDRVTVPWLSYRVLVDRALVVSGARSLASAGIPLGQAFEASAGFANLPSIRQAAKDVGAALSRGETGPGAVVLLGPLGAALLDGGAKEGAGPAVLDAVADLLEQEAAAGQAPSRSRIDLISLALGAVPVVCAGITYATNVLGLLGGAR